MAKDDNIEEKLVETEENLEGLKVLAQEYTKDAAEEGHHKFHKMHSELHAKTEDLLRELKPMLEKYRETGKEMMQRAEDKVVEKPLLSILVAFGIGIVIGKLCDRCKH